MALFCDNDPPLFSNDSRVSVATTLLNFRVFFQIFHGYLSTTICVFGVATNLMHVLVLTRPSMRNSVNCLLTAVAFCDMGTMSTYLIYLTHFELSSRPPNCYGFSKIWIQFLLVHVFVSIYLHSVSLWLVVALAFVRRMSLKAKRLQSEWQQPNRAWRICVIVFITVFVFCAPTLLVHKAAKLPAEAVLQCPDNKSSRFTVEISYEAQKNGCRLFKINLWMSGLLLKVVPSMLLIIFIVGLLYQFRQHSRRRSISFAKDSRNQQRTTAMLILILAIFLLTELPQGGLSILGAIFTRDVYQYIYAGVGDAMDLMSLINSSINFVLYLIMSSKYRQMFTKVVLPDQIYKMIYTTEPSNFDQGSRSRATRQDFQSETCLSNNCYSPSKPLLNSTERPRKKYSKTNNYHTQFEFNIYCETAEIML